MVSSLICCDFREQNFQRDQSFKFSILSPINFAHPAFT